MSGPAPAPEGVAGAETADARVTLLTFGHGTAPRGHLIPLLHGAGVREVVDVRTVPGSRRNPDAGRAALADWLPEAEIGYRWDGRLGGFRKAAPDSPTSSGRTPRSGDTPVTPGIRTSWRQWTSCSRRRAPPGPP
ncbi:DUF488 domain-containing protein [Microbispora bryophytorum]|uniref:DUF488 domain-containing protein n=1 Tax=Microbispora bryophytorum TaxID=1460882 RepID=UPI0033C20CCB